MKRGEIWWINFEPSIGGEIKKKRPAVIVSNDAANKYLNRVQIVPLASNVGRVYPSESVVTHNRKRSKAMADQITTVSKLRLINRAGRVTAADLRGVEEAIKVQLDLRG